MRYKSGIYFQSTFEMQIRIFSKGNLKTLLTQKNLEIKINLLSTKKNKTIYKLLGDYYYYLKT